jgi:integrase
LRLDELATTIRAEVNAGIFTQIVERMGPRAAHRLQGLLTVAAPGGMSMIQRLKKPAQRATWSRFKAQAAYLAEVDALGDTGAWLAGVAPAKVTDFAGEAAAQDIDTLSRYDPVKRLALVACLVHTARMRARDDLAEMLCKRVAANVKRARAELEEIRLRQRAVSERLIGTYRTAIIAVLLDTGARVEECARLDVEDFAITARTGEVRLHGKRDEVRSVPLSRRARDLVSAWLDVRGRHPGPVWLGQRGPLTVSGITQVVLATGADAGIPGLRPHRCRHTFATLLRRGGADPAQVQAMLGHASVDTAARYFRSGSAENAAVIERILDQ